MATATETAAKFICPACGLAVDVSKPHARLLLRPEVFHDDRCVGYYEGRMKRDAEVKHLRAALAQIANWPQAEMFTSLAPAISMKAIAKDALATEGEAVTP